MNDFILKQREMINIINSKLNEMESFLIGDKPVEERVELANNCMLDVIKNNSNDLDYAMHTIERIDIILKGGNN